MGWAKNKLPQLTVELLIIKHSLAVGCDVGLRHPTHRFNINSTFDENRRAVGMLNPPRSPFRGGYRGSSSSLGPLELQSRFGDRALKFQVICPQLPPKRDCSPKRVKSSRGLSPKQDCSPNKGQKHDIVIYTLFILIVDSINSVFGYQYRKRPPYIIRV